MPTEANFGATRWSRGPFVGRDREMAALIGALDSTRSGRGGLVVVSGEAGIGKSRLAEVLADEARSHGVRVVWGRCWEAGGAPAYWPWVQVLRSLIKGLDRPALETALAPTGDELARILPDLRDIFATPGKPTPDEESEAARFDLFDAVSRSIHVLAAGDPLVIMLDDLHAADEPSLLLLRFVSADLADSTVMLLGTYREGELDPADRRRARLAELGRQPGTIHVSPSRLDGGSIRSYMEAAIPHPIARGLVDAVLEQTEGNPLFMSEVVRLLVDDERGERSRAIGIHHVDIPEGVQEVIGRRLSRLSEEARRLLDRASVVGVEVPLEELVGSRSAPEAGDLALLVEATEADVLLAPSGARGAWRFRHALVREVVYRSLPAPERMRLHRAAAETLQELHRTDPDPPVTSIAHHLIEAVPLVDPLVAIDHARRAAELATAQAAYEESIRLLGRALSIATERDSVRVRILIELGEAATRAGDVRAAQEADLEAAELAERLGDAEELARAAIGYGGRFVWLRAGTDMILVPLLERALATLDDRDSVLRVRLLSRMAGALRSEAPMERRGSISWQALTMARRLDEPLARTFALLARYFAISGPDSLDELQALVDEMTALIPELGDRERLYDVHLARYNLLVMKGAPEAEVRAVAGVFEQLAHALRQPPLIWWHTVLRAIRAVNEGRLDLAETLNDEAFRVGSAIPLRDASVSWHLLRFAVRREQGRLSEIADAIRSLPSEYPDYPFLRCAALYVDALDGQTDAARHVLSSLAEDGFRAFPRDMSWLFALSLLAETALLTGDASAGRAIGRQVRPFGHLFGMATAEIHSGPVGRILGLLAAQEGRYDEALGWLEDAERRSAVAGLVSFQARSMVDIAMTLRRRSQADDEARCRQLAVSAALLADRHGLVATAQRARSLLEAEPLAPTPPHPPSPAVAMKFVRDGDVWQIGRDPVFRLRHSKGLAYLDQLLRTPGREHHALDLVSGIVGHGSAGTPTRPERDAARQDAAGPIPAAGLDEEARHVYRLRLAELRSEIEMAEAANDRARADEAHIEIEALTRELASAYGLGGRERPRHSSAERARQSVTKALRDAIARVEAQHAELGAHLDHSVRTGTYCSYDPDPASNLVWHFA